MKRIVYVGERHTLEAEFYSIERAPASVAEGVVVYIREPNSPNHTGPFAATRVATGIYNYDYYPEKPGVYLYRFQDPDGTVIAESRFQVKRSVFDTIPEFPTVEGLATTPDYDYVGVDSSFGFGVLDVPFYTYVGVDALFNVVELGVTPSFAYEGVDGELGLHPMIFLVGEDEHFYTINGVFDTEVDTGLDLTGLNIVDIDRDQVDGVIWGVTSNGSVYSWNDDGTSLSLVFTTGFTDLTEIVVDNSNRLIALSSHQASLFNIRTYFYQMDGTFLYSYENRSGSNSFDESVLHIDGGYGFIWASSNSGTGHFGLYRMSVATGLVEFYQSRIAFVTSAGAIDYQNLRAFIWVGGSVAEYDMSTLNNGSTPPLIGPLGTSQAGAASMAYMEWYGGGEYVLACGKTPGAAPLSYMDLNALTDEVDHTTTRFKTMCTRRRYS